MGKETCSLKIFVSILAADFRNLEKEIRRAEDAGADGIHLDIMDGHFVPNLALGFHDVEAISKLTRLPLEAHLMVQKPLDYWKRFADLGVGAISAHVETLEDPEVFLAQATEAGMTPGLAIKPKTPLSKIIPHISNLGFILQMTVEPGFYGQAFLPETLPRLNELHTAFTDSPNSKFIEVDGGIGPATIAAVSREGATQSVVGSAAFKPKDMTERLKTLKELC